MRDPRNMHWCGIIESDLKLLNFIIAHPDCTGKDFPGKRYGVDRVPVNSHRQRRRLEEMGLVCATPIAGKGGRYSYTATDRGCELAEDIAIADQYIELVVHNFDLIEYDEARAQEHPQHRMKVGHKHSERTKRRIGEAVSKARKEKGQVSNAS